MNDYDVNYMRLEFSIDIPGKVLYGKTLIRIQSLVANLSSIDLDLSYHLTVDSISGCVSSYLHSMDRLTINFSENYKQGEYIEIGIAYHGSPNPSGYMGFDFGTHNGAPVVSTLSEPFYSHTWFPCKDLPEDKIDSIDIIITVPDTLIAVSNGVLKNITDNGNQTKTFFWEERYPIAPYLITIAVSNYVHRQQTYSGLSGISMPVDYWIYPENVDSAIMQTLSLTPEMIQFFSSLFGEYPFIREKYGMVQFPWHGGMEHQTCTSLGGFDELLICHELVHQWWGDMVTCANWHHIWLNEGFARYGEALWQEHRYGFDDLKKFMGNINRPDAWHSNRLYVIDVSSESTILDRIVYDKGAWALHMLRKIAGDSLFWQIFQQYRSEYYMSIAQTRDFQSVCETVCKTDFDWFFNEWVYGEGQPHYKVSWYRSRINDQQWTLDLYLDQIQTTSTIFKIPVDVLVKWDDGSKCVTIWDSLKSQEFHLICDHKPEEVVIDPDGWILKNVSYLNNNPDIYRTLTDFHLSKPYPNPFNQFVSFEIFLPYDVEGSVSVYDLTGRLIERICSGNLRAGYFILKWKPVNCSSGIYFIRIETDDIHKQRKVVYLK